MVQPSINIAVNYEDLCERVTRKILLLSREIIAKQGRFTMVLSGGSTPKGIYECMAKAHYRNEFDWERIHLFWGDERCVPPDDQRSNYRMVSDALLTKIKIPSVNIHPLQTEHRDPQASARLYEGTISSFFNLNDGQFPCFDLILLGIGQDGHTASLFPGNPALLEKDRLVAAVSQKGIPEKRITLTFPAINHADKIFFLVSGMDKAGIVKKVLESKNGSFPADGVKPVRGGLCWFLDNAAAGGLEQ